ncbi:MAG: ankyrin repeat domain-containing protein [Patescibacteria group bacterium]
MYSKKTQQDLVNLLEKLKGEKNIDNIVFSLFEKNLAVLTAVDEKTGVSFFAALVSLGKSWLVCNAIKRLHTEWDDWTEERFSLAFKMDKSGAYPLDRAYRLNEGKDKEEIIKSIFEKGYGFIGFEAITYFIKKDDSNMLQKIFKNNEDFNLHHLLQLFIPWNELFKEKTFLMTAAEYDAVSCAKFLVEKIGVKIDLKNREGETALDIARLMGNTRVMEYLETQTKR